MSSTRPVRLVAATAASALALTGLGVVVALPSSAAGAPSVAGAQTITPTSKQLASWGFTKKPNVTAWGPGGTMQLSTTSAPAWGDVYVTGTAPKGTRAGQVLTLKRFVPTSLTGDGSFTDLGITTTVTKKRTFTLHVQLGRTGLYGYSLGYTTGGTSPETVAGEFQLKTTKGLAPQTLLPATVTSAQLASWGFTKKPNVAAWPGGTAKLSTTSAAAGADVTLKGAATRYAKPGQKLSLKRFVPTDTEGSGYFKAVNATTKVNRNGTYTLVFDLGVTGLYGYTVGFASDGEWIGVEFQLRTT